MEPAMPTGSHSTAEDSSTAPSNRAVKSPADSQSGPGSHGPRNAVLRAIGLIAVIIAWLGIAGLGGPAIGSLSSVQSNDQETFLPTGAESVQAANAAAGFNNSGELPAFVIFETSGAAATPDQLAAWQAFTQTLPEQPVDTAKPALGTIA